MAEALKNREEHSILLRNASWETYERLLAEREERRSPRFFYERGALEILSPSAEHYITSRIVATLVELLAEEADTDVENAGSTTFKREDLACGFEPDECFYFGGNVSRVRDLVSYLPGLIGEALTHLIAEGLSLDRRVWRRRVRESVRELS